MFGQARSVNATDCFGPGELVHLFFEPESRSINNAPAGSLKKSEHFLFVHRVSPVASSSDKKRGGVAGADAATAGKVARKKSTA
jgi:hypothetical protein